MPNAWTGADPVETIDAADYELGTVFRANVDISITHVRVNTGAGEIDIASRRGRIWSTGGTQLGLALMPTSLATGWTTHALDVPVTRSAGQTFIASYMTGGNYSSTAGALSSDVNSADGAVTALSNGTSPLGNGVFNGTPGLLPDQTGGGTFYGVDIIYELSGGGNTAPVITDVAVATDALEATVTVTATDAETLVGATYSFSFGDGTAPVVGASNTASHSYLESGDYAALISVTDAGGLSDHEAALIQVAGVSAGSPLPTGGACEAWPIRWPCDISCESPSVTGDAATAATDVLWALSGRQFGLCEVTLRPCRRECVAEGFADRELLPWQGEHIQPSLIGGEWYNLTCGSCPGSCSCTSISEVYLPGIVNSIVEVKVDGIVLPSTAYRVDNDRLLVRTDGEEWPRCNDLSLDDTEPGTWSVTAVFGRVVPIGGQWAVGELACELLKAFRGEDCRLPRNVTQLARQGVTISYPDMNDLFSRGRTGLYLSDMWIASVNPANLQTRSRTYSIDRPQARRAGTA